MKRPYQVRATYLVEVTTEVYANTPEEAESVVEGMVETEGFYGADLQIENAMLHEIEALPQEVEV